MLKKYIKLFLESSFANQSQNFSDILKSLEDEERITNKNKKLKSISLEKDKKRSIEDTIDLLKHSGPSNTIPRSHLFLSNQPKKKS